MQGLRTPPHVTECTSKCKEKNLDPGNTGRASGYNCAGEKVTKHREEKNGHEDSIVEGSEKVWGAITRYEKG